MPPKVTVLLPVFNRERLVGDAIQSVLEQDFQDFELLAVDDGSTDRTAEVLEAWTHRDPRVVVVTSPTNQGLAAALNLGLSRARGAYVARIDSDDLMMPGHLAAEVVVLDAHPEVVVVSCPMRVVDFAGNSIGTWRNDEPHEVTAFLLNFANVVGGGQVMFRRKEVLEAGAFRVDFTLCEDYELWVRLLRRGRVEMLPFPGIVYRQHDSQMSRVDGGRVKRPFWMRIMRSSLEPYLGRPVRDEEIDALITVWRRDGALGMARIADAVMREAFARFRDEIPDRVLHARARRRIARQWYLAARNFVRRGHPLEAINYLARAASWRILGRNKAAARES